MNSLTSEQLATLANETRRQNTALQAEGLKGQLQALSTAAQVIGSLSQDAGMLLATANQQLAALSIGAGPGITSDFGPKADHLAAFLKDAVGKGILTDTSLIESLESLAQGRYTAPAASNEATAPLFPPEDTEAPAASPEQGA